MIREIIEELNKSNSSNYKLEVLKKYKDNNLFKRVLKMTYDKVQYTYGISMKNISYSTEAIYERSGYSLNEALDRLEMEFATRNITGNKALDELTYILENLSKDNAEVLEKVINRDLKINIGKTQINKIFKGLITKPPYSRCEIGSSKNIKINIDFTQKVYSQEKMDGTYRSCIKDLDSITFFSRSGIEGEFPTIKEEIKQFPDGYAYLGEMTILLNEETYKLAYNRLVKKKATEEDFKILEKAFNNKEGMLPRGIGNGMINSDNIPHKYVVFTLWNMIPLEEYNKKLGEINYENLFNKLEEFLEDKNFKNVKLCEYKIVHNMKDTYEHFNEITSKGGEGTIIKAHNLKWKDGNSKQQLKIKLEIDIDVRVTSFNAGNKGSKNEDYFSGINYTTDDDKIQGAIGVTSMTEKERDWFDENRELVIGNVIEVTCNNITKATGTEYYSLSHPRYKCLRGSEKETNTLQESFDKKEMAMELS